VEALLSDGQAGQTKLRKMGPPKNIFEQIVFPSAYKKMVAHKELPFFIFHNS
jgi:hypothetical protein